MSERKAHGFHPENALQTARIKSGLQQKDIANLLGCSIRTIQSYESSSPPPYHVIIKMKQYYGCEYSDLFP